jgi:hypothetical protein
MLRRAPAIVTALALVIALGACSKKNAGFEIAPGTDVMVEKKDGVTVTGKLVEVQPERVVLEARDGVRTLVPRADIVNVRTQSRRVEPEATPATPAQDSAAPASARASETTRGTAPAAPRPVTSAAPHPADGASPASPRSAAGPSVAEPEYRDVTIPAGTVMAVQLRTSLSSAKNHVEDPVQGALTRGVHVGGAEALPAGTLVTGHVTDVERSGRVKGRARIAFRFTQVDAPGEGGRQSMRTDTIAREADATKKKDAAKIGGAAAGGAIIGGIIGGGGGAAKGAAIGGAAGTGVVVSTRGDEVAVASGTSVSVKLLEPVTLRLKR